MANQQSLWLLPPKDSAIDIKLDKLLHRKMPSLFAGEPMPRFAPHITLATGIDASFFEPRTPQEWLDSLDFGAVHSNDLDISFAGIGTGNTFTNKCYLQVVKTMSLEDLEVEIQKKVFRLDLLMKTLPSVKDEERQMKAAGNQEQIRGIKADEIEARKAAKYWEPHLSLFYSDGTLSAEQLAAVETKVAEEGIVVDGTHISWSGGRIQLVDTSQSVQEWVVLAERFV